MAVRTIEFLRIANPWLVGKNVGRVVPVYSIHNVLAPNLKTSPDLPYVMDLTVAAKDAMAGSIGTRVDVADEDLPALQATASGLLAPEKRVFAAKKGGASKNGSLFPMVGGLVSKSPSDDGLGKRVRELLEHHNTDWQERLCALLLPTQAKDPATAFATTLLGGNAGATEPKTPVRKKRLTGLDLACAQFIDNLIVATGDADRIGALRQLALGIYFVATMRMVAGPVSEIQRRCPKVLVFGGMPPGSTGMPLVRVASESFSDWIGESLATLPELLRLSLEGAAQLPKSGKSSQLRQRVLSRLLERNPQRLKEMDAVLDEMKPILAGASLSKSWCKLAVDSREVGISKPELARRVRSMGANIGLAGPDRGLRPRLIVDTPLLGVLVKGIVGTKSMEFSSFVSQLAQQFGLVLGLGTDDSVADELGLSGSGGFDTYELLIRNQELLRERMLRAGLARSYSDSHTEVFSNV